MTDKEAKKAFRVLAQQQPDRFYPVKTLKGLGFMRKQCEKCRNYFWSVDGDRKICGDSACVGGFGFIGDSPAKKQLDYVETWKTFVRIHKKLGYTPIARYPVVARWRTDTDFVQAGIYIFQPFVVSGEVEPPANPVVEPQFCLRFNDVDNVGVTGSHYVGFVMMGEHAFMPPKKYDVNQYMSDHLTWLNKGMGLDFNELTLHEDAWAGGGNLGPSMEFFSRGLELSNQVYMQYELQPNGGYKDLAIKVLDMGQGQERVPWFTSGSATSYETTFPTVLKKLRKITDTPFDKVLMGRFMQYAALLNVDEVVDVQASWQRVAKAIGMPFSELQKQIGKSAALYSIAEHSRALLVALHDGALFSNVGGGYNLRVVFRRMLDLAARYGWNVPLTDLFSWHAHESKSFFPELNNNLDNVHKIIDAEKNKYEATRQKTASIVARVVNEKINNDMLLQLYDSQGISPELLREEAEKVGVAVSVPDDFYARVGQLHEKKKQVHETHKQEKLGLSSVPETTALYFDDWHPPAEFRARVMKIIDTHVVLDQTWFYPTSGGQLHDLGFLNGILVVDVFKQGSVIVHTLEHTPLFKEGNVITGVIDYERRKQLSQHHTSTHIVNAAARRLLGAHVNQAGAKKTMDKASIDITHYVALSDNELLMIEKEAQRIVAYKIEVRKRFFSRDAAEKKFGVVIYQGGVPPGKMLRIVEIPNVDVEACGGTHLNNTSEAEVIHIIGSSKIADDIVRIEFVAGQAARQWEEHVRKHGSDIQSLVKQAFGFSVDASPHHIQAAADVFSVSSSVLKETVARFVSQVQENLSKLSSLHVSFEKHTFVSRTIDKFCSELFEYWKKQEKELAKATEAAAQKNVNNLKEKSVALLSLDQPGLREAAQGFTSVLLLNNDGFFVYKGSEEKFKELVFGFGAKGGGREMKQGKVENVQKVVKGFRF